ncbi:hypothetical protein ASC93_04580 [Massilia sp. Root335]|nr:hypothetical protein ASC93_04580 [Massilia sp. Root335]
MHHKNLLTGFELESWLRHAVCQLCKLCAQLFVFSFFVAHFFRKFVRIGRFYGRQASRTKFQRKPQISGHDVESRIRFLLGEFDYCSD